MDRATASLREIVGNESLTRANGEVMPVSRLKTQLFDQPEFGMGSDPVIARLEGAEYVRTGHVTKGDHAAIALNSTCLRPASPDRPADRGWIGSGSNSFIVEDTIDVDGTYFHTGVVAEGGFHESKLNWFMRRT